MLLPKLLTLALGVKLIIDVSRDSLATLLTGGGRVLRGISNGVFGRYFKKCSRGSLLLKPDMIVATEMVRVKT